MTVTAAKSRVVQARMQLESERIDEASSTVAQGLRFLEGLPEAETAAVRAELEAIRALITGLPREEDVRTIRAATGTLKQLRGRLADGQHFGVGDALRTVETILAEVPPAMIVDQIAEIAALRAELARVAPTAVAALTEDQQAVETRAKTRLLQARSLLESGQTDRIAGVLDEAIAFITQLPVAMRPPLEAELAAIRTEAGGAASAESRARITDELERHWRDAEAALATDVYEARVVSDRIERRLGEADVQAALGPTAMVTYLPRLSELRGRIATAIKAAALARAQPIAAELEGYLAGDPFAGKTQPEAYAVTSQVETLKNRLRDALRGVPADDPDVAALATRIHAVDQHIEDASAAWGKAHLDAMNVKR